MTTETIILGDFNIDFKKRYMVDYVNRYLFVDFDDALANFGMEQLVNFVTWSRLVNSVLKSSILDHIYAIPSIFRYSKCRFSTDRI